LEAYFRNDPRIREWINQIVEKVFTVCLLTGVDSDVEFQKGCQTVIKLASLLQEIATFPAEYLADGVKQLLEQQLPDIRVSNNFPAFQATMDRMIREGLLKATETNNLSSHTQSTKEINKTLHAGYTERLMGVSHVALINDSVIPTLATFNIPYPNIKQTKVDAYALADALTEADARAQAEAQAKADALALAEALAQVDALTKALDQADEQAKGDAQALAQTEARAKADAQALADVLDQLNTLTRAKKQAHADALALTDVLAQAEVRAKVDAQALADALDQADAQARADALALAEALTQVDVLTKALAQAEARAKADAQALADVLGQLDTLTQSEEQAKAKALTLAEDLVQANARADADALALADTLAQVDALIQANVQVKAESQALADVLTQAETQAKADTLAFAEALAQSEAKYEAVATVERHEQVVHPSQVPQQADLLKSVLSDIFPKGNVYWNKSLMGQTFLAQVEDILIYLHDPKQPCKLTKFHKEGWKVFVCSNEDLAYPRRLERGIRQIQRLGRKSLTL